MTKIENDGPAKVKRLLSTKLIWDKFVVGLGIYFTPWFFIIQVAKWAIFIGPHKRNEKAGSSN